MNKIRKNGARKHSLSDESSSEALKISKRMLRVDWGGKNAEEQIRKKALESGIKLGPMTCKFIKELIDHQINGCRKRMYPRIDEVINRLENTKQTTESAP